MITTQAQVRLSLQRKYLARRHRLSEWIARIGLLAVVVAMMSACSTNPVSGKRDFVLMSESQEIALGQQSHQQILQQYTPYNDAELSALVNRVGQKLAAKGHRNHLRYTFTLLDSPEVNAFALPGGYIYITRGIMAYMNSEEELAGVLGHELGHVTARHGVKQQSAAQAGGLVTILVAAATGSSDVAELSNTLNSALVSGYGRNHELEADRLGAEYIAKVGYTPESMLDVIGILKNQEDFAKLKAGNKGEPASGYHGVFSSHPDNDKRLQEVIRAANKFANPNAVASDPAEFLRLTDGMIYGHSEAQGIVKGNQFYHKDFDLNLTFPEGWQVQNQPDRLLAVSPDKQQLIQMLLGDQKQTDPAVYLRQSFPTLRTTQSLGVNAFMGVTALDSPWGKRTGRVAAVKHQGHMLVLLAVANSQPPGQDFVDTIKSVRGLKASEKKLAKAHRIKLIKAAKGETFTRLAKQSSLTEYAEAQLRLLNGMYPKGEPKPGQLLKIVK